MTKRTFEIEWKDDLDPMWINEDNLLICLNTKAHCGDKLIMNVKDITASELTKKISKKLWPNMEVITNWEDWPTFGLMVEDAKERKFRMRIIGTQFALIDTQNWRNTTNSFCIEEHGYIKACALAWLETFDD